MSTVASYVGSLGPTGIIVGMLLALVVGLSIMGLGQTYYALREIALNTRATAKASGPAPLAEATYGGLVFLGGAMEIMGALICLTALGGGIALLTGAGT